MSFYSFKCDNCGVESEYLWSYSKFDENTKNCDGNTFHVDICECGGFKRNVIGNIGLGPDIYKNDPNSNQFWKKGKTISQIADVLNGGKSPY